MLKVTPFLWFAGNVEEAVKHYTSIFKNSRVISTGGFDGPRSAVRTAKFELEGQTFYALDTGADRPWSFTGAISLFVDCDTQAEVDELWERLSEGGRKDQCGWLTDKFGVTWQIVPRALGELMSDPDPKKARRVVDAMMQMRKLDIAALKEAHARPSSDA